MEKLRALMRDLVKAWPLFIAADLVADGWINEEASGDQEEWGPINQVQKGGRARKGELKNAVCRQWCYRHNVHCGTQFMSTPAQSLPGPP